MTAAAIGTRMSSQPKARQRLDQALVARGLAPTRARARDLVLRGAVSVDGAIASKPAAAVDANASLAIDAAADRYVSRGGLKLAAALAHFPFEVAGRVALDVGASTGGFTDVLLQAGAQRVYAIDVGRDQLHPRVAADPRVIRREGTDARELTRADIPDAIQAIVADVSFVSLTKVLSAPLALAAPGCWLVVLVKPQFEAGRAAVGKGGIVTDPADRERAVTEVSAWIAQQSGWQVIGRLESPISGGSGNVETLLGAIKNG
jgi:23S rRNA (cytidine1920-2'-O)/16S rRNA (cytidine1409-2'-O)-methyltransferase